MSNPFLEAFEKKFEHLYGQGLTARLSAGKPTPPGEQYTAGDGKCSVMKQYRRLLAPFTVASTGSWYDPGRS